MCGRFTLAADVKSFEDDIEHLLVQFSPGPRYNIAPTQQVATVLNEARPRLAATRWGLLPRWAKDMGMGARMINARSETVHEKPSFKEPLARQRCLVLTDGFYEWKKEAGSTRKTPYHISMRTRRPFAFAGLWDTWANPDGGQLRTCTIITTDPNPLMADLHNRMPVILNAATWSEWLAPAPLSPERLHDLFLPYPAEGMEAYPVSTHVNKPVNDDSECIARV